MINVYIDTSELSQLSSSFTLDDNLKKQIVERCAEIIDPWVPYKTGEMSKNYNTTSSDIIYNMDYASERYYIPAMRYTTTYHPLATYRWDEVALASGAYDSIEESAKQIIENDFQGRIK